MNSLLIHLLLIGSVLVGGLMVSFLQKKSNANIIKLMLAFSGGFLLSIAFIHFIPELYEHSTVKVGIFILIGFLIQLFLEFFSGGIEHGHIHAHKNAKIPITLILALSVHALLEGIPLGSQLVGHEVATSHHHGNDNSLLWGILFHRLPVAIALMTLISYSGVTGVKKWVYFGIFGLSTSIGVFIGEVTGQYQPDFNFDIILAIIVGMFFHISTTIIFETSENHKFNFAKLMTILAGSALAFFIH